LHWYLHPCGHPLIVTWNVSCHLPSKNNPVDKIDLFVSTGSSSGLQIDPIYRTVETGPASEMVGIMNPNSSNIYPMIPAMHSQILVSQHESHTSAIKTHNQLQQLARCMIDLKTCNVDRGKNMHKEMVNTKLPSILQEQNETEININIIVESVFRSSTKNGLSAMCCHCRTCNQCNLW
jgi:hypothetical protein